MLPCLKVSCNDVRMYVSFMCSSHLLILHDCKCCIAHVCFFPGMEELAKENMLLEEELNALENDSVSYYKLLNQNYTDQLPTQDCPESCRKQHDGPEFVHCFAFF